MSPIPSLRGRFVWHELMTSDTTAAIAFYTKVVGWKTEAWAEMPDYKMWVGARGPVGGLMTIPEEAKLMGAPPSWLAYIGTPSADATAEQAVRLGGKILKPAMDIPSVGRFVVLADPQGAVFAAFTPTTPMPTDITPQLGEFSWHELITTDPDAGFRFYSALFGWEKTEGMDMGAMGTYQMYGWPGVSQGGMYRKPPEMAAPPHWMHYTTVPDVKKAAPVIKALGGMVIMGPHEVPGGSWIVIAIDPQGAAFALHSNLAAPAKKAARRAGGQTGRKAAKKKVAKKAARRTVKRPAKKGTKKRGR